MQLLLTDRLACPRCGPRFGLILLAHRLEERRVHEGVLGCPNCRDSFPVVAGVADLRPPPRGSLPRGLAGVDPAEGEAGGGAADAAARPDAEESERLIALLGIVGGPGTVALVGEPARHAAAVAAARTELLVAAIDADVAGWAEAPGVSRLVAGASLPFFSAMLRGVVVDGRLGEAALIEAARVLAPRARVVVVHAAEPVPALLEAQGLAVLASEAETVVAARG